MEVPEEVGQYGLGNDLVIDVHAFVEGLVASASTLVGGLAVELLGVDEEIERSQQQLSAQGELAVGLGDLVAESFSIVLELGQAGADLGRGDRAVRGQIQEPLFGVVEFAELERQAGLQGLGGSALVRHEALQLSAHTGLEVFGEWQAAVLVDDSGFDSVDGQVRQVAHAVLPATAHVVSPALAIATAGEGVDDSGLSSGVMTASAEKQALEVVVMLSLPGASSGSEVQDFLNAVVEFRADEGRMPTWVFGSLVFDDTLVVGIAQHLVQLGQRDRATRAVAGWAGGETQVQHGLVKELEGVVAGGVELPRLLDERCTFFVDSYAADFVTVDLDSDVLIAQGGSPEGAAVLGLLAHLVADVGAVFGGAELVEGGQDAVHELADGGVVDALGGRDEGDLVAAQQHEHFGVVDPVAVQAGQLVDEHVVDVTLGANALEHLLECGALLDAGG